MNRVPITFIKLETVVFGHRHWDLNLSICKNNNKPCTSDFYSFLQHRWNLIKYFSNICTKICQTVFIWTESDLVYPEVKTCIGLQTLINSSFFAIFIILNSELSRLLHLRWWKSLFWRKKADQIITYRPLYLCTRGYDFKTFIFHTILYGNIIPKFAQPDPNLTLSTEPCSSQTNGRKLFI